MAYSPRYLINPQDIANVRSRHVDYLTIVRVAGLFRILSIVLPEFAEDRRHHSVLNAWTAAVRNLFFGGSCAAVLPLDPALGLCGRFSAQIAY
ncbi:MAG TPA: hypothetical protein DDW52_14035 [Planctomycetaceae bacterium]|nr:hypothetical protein [Planctomycetaceae bacterium]